MFMFEFAGPERMLVVRNVLECREPLLGSDDVMDRERTMREVIDGRRETSSDSSMTSFSVLIACCACHRSAGGRAGTGGISSFSVLSSESIFSPSFTECERESEDEVVGVSRPRRRSFRDEYKTKLGARDTGALDAVVTKVFAES